MGMMVAEDERLFSGSVDVLGRPLRIRRRTPFHPRSHAKGRGERLFCPRRATKDHEEHLFIREVTRRVAENGFFVRGGRGGARRTAGERQGGKGTRTGGAENGGGGKRNAPQRLALGGGGYLPGRTRKARGFTYSAVRAEVNVDHLPTPLLSAARFMARRR